MPRATKTTLAKIKAMSDGGASPHFIGRTLGHDGKSVRKWLRLTDFEAPEMKQLVEKIKSNEVAELCLVGGMAREILLNYLDACLKGEEKPNVISVIAAMDRAFQQKQILSGGATANININLFARTVEAACEQNEEKIAKCIEEVKKPEDKD